MSNVRLPVYAPAPVSERSLRAPSGPDSSAPPQPHAHGEAIVTPDKSAGHALGTSGASASLQVGDLARESGKTVRAIHLYEEMDLLKPAARSKGRYRLYGPEALVRIRWIQKLQDLGFSLPDIKAIVKDVEQRRSASSAMSEVRAVYSRKLEETRAQIARLQGLESEILASIEYLETCDSRCDRDRVLAACNDCDHHPAQQSVPDLVAGLRTSG